jgi:acetate kinase
MAILSFNVGSSSVKFGLFDSRAQQEITSGIIEGSDPRASLERAIRSARPRTIDAVGHRVHGGTSFQESVRIDRGVLQKLERLSEIAPLHNPPALAGISAVTAALPNVPQVAVFDTAYYRGLPERAFVYPLPYQWYEDWGIRRFGFHGISHSYCAARAEKLLGARRRTPRLVTCHLGNGCSATASLGGEPVATSMGFTPWKD